MHNTENSDCGFLFYENEIKDFKCQTTRIVVEPIIIQI